MCQKSPVQLNTDLHNRPKMSKLHRISQQRHTKQTVLVKRALCNSAETYQTDQMGERALRGGYGQ